MTPAVAVASLALIVSIVAACLSALTFYRNFVYESHDLSALVVGTDPPAGILTPQTDRYVLIALINTGTRNATLIAARLVFWNFATAGWGTFAARNETSPPQGWPEDYSPWLADVPVVIGAKATTIVRLPVPRQGPNRITFKDLYWRGDKMVLGVACRSMDSKGRVYICRFQIGVAGADPAKADEWIEWVAASKNVHMHLFEKFNAALFADGNVDPLVTTAPSSSAAVDPGRPMMNASEIMELSARLPNGGTHHHMRLTLNDGI
jgi:hypothetical protein